MHSYLEGLNDKQKEAVLCTDGALLIIAGAGSGKTKALTHRIAYMISEKGIRPDNILAVTFTNKAASEMKERVGHLLGVQAEKETPWMTARGMPTVGTFHSICVRILRNEIHVLGFENSFSIYDTADQVSLMKMLMKEKHIDEKQYNPKAVLSAISNAKNELITPEKYVNYVGTPFHELVNELYPLYQKHLKQARALDFDDIIMKTVELFLEHPQILEKYQEKFKYISVDEYQDTNHGQ